MPIKYFFNNKEIINIMATTLIGVYLVLYFIMICIISMLLFYFFTKTIIFIIILLFCYWLGNNFQRKYNND